MYPFFNCIRIDVFSLVEKSVVCNGFMIEAIYLVIGSTAK